MNISDALSLLVASEDLSQEQMADVMRSVMTGEVTPAQIGALLVALRMKGETIDEISGAAQVMRELAIPVKVSADNVVDTCGTGGDGSNLFNVSTASAFVVAAAGGNVAKHGNRSVSSSSGSADVLEAANINLSMSPEQVGRAVDSIGVGFMFAPAHHGAMKHAIGPRRELGLRTIFNLLGPMTNPAGVKRQVLGVFDPSLCRPMAEVLGRLGSEHVLVVNAIDGLDEFSIAAKTHVAELKDGEISEYLFEPSSVGLSDASLDGLAVETAQQSLDLIYAAFGRKSGVDPDIAERARSIIGVNAGAALYVAGIASSIPEGYSIAEDVMASGHASEKIKELAEFSQVCE